MAEASRFEAEIERCRFVELEVEYLGHVSEAKKIEAIYKFPVPQDVKSLHSFLGLASSLYSMLL